MGEVVRVCSWFEIGIAQVGGSGMLGAMWM
jgi:hypothetical protein